MRTVIIGFEENPLSIQRYEKEFMQEMQLIFVSRGFLYILKRDLGAYFGTT